MKSSTYILLALFIALLAVTIGGLVIWFVGENETVVTMSNPSPLPAAEEPEQGTLETPTPPPPSPGRRSPSVESSSSPSTAMPPAPPPAPVVPADEEPPPGELPEEPPNWDAQLQDVLTSGKSEQEIAVTLLGMLEEMPPERQEDTAHLMAGLMPDEGYAAIIPMLTHPQTPEKVADALMVDLLDRPESLQLPLFLEIARNPAHPRRAEALDYLGLYLEVEHGENWGAWQETIQTRLSNPEP